MSDVSRLTAELTPTGHSLALWMGLHARPVGRGRLGAVPAVRAEFASQRLVLCPERRVLGLKSRDVARQSLQLRRKPDHDLDNKTNDRVWALSVGCQRPGTNALYIHGSILH